MLDTKDMDAYVVDPNKHVTDVTPRRLVMFCRFVTQSGLANSQANRQAIILEIRKVLDGTYTSMNSLNATYFDRSASILVGGGTGGLGAIKA